MSAAPATRSTPSVDVTVRPMLPGDVDAADRIMRVAFGTFVGHPRPDEFMGDASLVRPRFRADPSSAFVAEVDGRVVGSNLVTTWGAFGFFGPLSVDPGHWGRGIAQLLMEPVLDAFRRRGTRQHGLFTFPGSPLHVGLYERYGFHPRTLTAVMSRSVAPSDEPASHDVLSALSDEDRARLLDGVQGLTARVLLGLELGGEIAAAELAGGDTVFVSGRSGLESFAVVHAGPGSEAGSGTCYVKVGMARPGRGAPARFERLLRACDSFARSRGAPRLVAGVNTARTAAYAWMRAAGFRADILGIAMLRPDASATHRHDVWMLDDWR